MPEEPEVETARRLIADLALGRRIVGVDDADTFVCRPHSPGELRAALTGRTLIAAHRRGKTMWCETSGLDGPDLGPTLGIHLGMSGRIVVTSPDGWVAEGGDRPGRDAQPRKAAWDRFTLEFADGGRMALFDKRRLGRILLDPDIGALGPDAAEVTPAQFRTLITKGTIAVKARLLDQSKIAGIGNLLADEILWQAKIPPATPVNRLQRKDTDRLYRALRSVLGRAMADGGGAHTGDVIAARRPGGSCPCCGAEMVHGTVGGRSTWWCSREQAPWPAVLGFAGQIAHDLDFGPQRQAIAQLLPGPLGGGAMELGLADVLDGLVRRAGRGQRARIHVRVGELQGERNLEALHIAESVRLEQLLARARPTQRHHRRLVVDLLRRGQAERGQRPSSGGRLDVTPHRYPGTPAGAKDPVYFGHRAGCGAPDPPEAGHDVERRGVPRQGVHIADPDVGVGAPVPGHRHEPGRGIDTGAGGTAQMSQLEREPRPAGHVEQPVSGVDAQSMVHNDVFPAVARLAERREVHRLAAPALVRHLPLGKVGTRCRHVRSLG